jgi:hypothetical protein
MFDPNERFERVLFLIAIVAMAVVLSDVFIWRP